MAKKSKKSTAETDGELEQQQEDGTVQRAMTKNKFNSFLKKVMASQHVVNEESAAISEFIAHSVEHEGLDRTAWAMAKRLLKIKEGERGTIGVQETLFHFHVYCKYLGFGDQGALELGDRGEGEADEETVDLRPRHMRQPGALADADPATEH